MILLSYFIFGLNRIGGTGITIKRKNKYDMSAFLMAALLNITLNFILIPAYGIIGAALATLLSYFSAYVVKHFFSQKLYKISYNIKDVIIYFALGLILFLITASVCNEGNTWSFLIKIFISAVYLSALFFFDKNITANIKNLFKAMSHKTTY